jgi:hypothetical protein
MAAAQFTEIKDPYNEALHDTDVTLIDSRVLAQGVLERFAEMKKLPFVPRFDSLLRKAFERTKPAKNARLSRNRRFPWPRIKESGHGFGGGGGGGPLPG